MKTKLLLVRIVSLLLVAYGTSPLAVQESSGTQPITIPFDLPLRHVLVKVTVNNSRPLSFVLDTGAHAAIIRMDVAKELGLKLQGQVNARGAGPGSQTGSQVKGATWSLVGLPGFSQPLTLALPLIELSKAMGQPVEGIIGGEFIRKFVVELDYQAQHIRLHRPESFRYSGPGIELPIQFVQQTHPTVAATVTPVGGSPLAGQFMFDIGSGQALILHSPFVNDKHLMPPDNQTIRAMGGAGIGGRSAGRLGRVESLQLGPYTLKKPVTMFSQDSAGAFANPALAGNIGGVIAKRFRIYLDYGRSRMIIEPSSAFGGSFDRAFSGLVIRAFGDDFKTFRVIDVLENTPGAAAGIKEGDVITALDDTPAERLTLAMIDKLLEKTQQYRLTIQRENQTMTVSLTPARLI